MKMRKPISLLFVILLSPAILLGLLLLPFINAISIFAYKLTNHALGFKEVERGSETYYKRGRDANFYEAVIWFLLIGIISAAIILVMNGLLSGWRLQIGIKPLAVLFLKPVAVFLLVTQSIFFIRFCYQYWAFQGIPSLTDLKKNMILRQRFDERSLWLYPFVSTLMVAICCSSLPLLFLLPAELILFQVLLNFVLPPVVLFLSTSAQSTMVLQVKIRRKAYLLDASLLNDKADYSQSVTGFGGPFAVYRTKNPELWVDTVTKLMDMCAVIILDTRTITDPVVIECNLVFALSHERKTLFVVGEDSSFPVLDKVLEDAPSHAGRHDELCERLFTEAEIIRLFGDLKTVRKKLSPVGDR